MPANDTKQARKLEKKLAKARRKADRIWRALVNAKWARPASRGKRHD